MSALTAITTMTSAAAKLKPKHHGGRHGNGHSSSSGTNGGAVTTTTNRDGETVATIQVPVGGKEEKPPIESLLDEDMTVAADAIGLNYETRTALKQYDARSLEDFCFMSQSEFESMIVAEYRLGNPIPPLQQRKVLVLLEWIHRVSEDSQVERAANAFTKSPSTSDCSSVDASNNKKGGNKKKVGDNNVNKPSFFHRLVDPYGTMSTFHQTAVNSIKVTASFGTASFGYDSPSKSTSSTAGEIMKEDYKYVIIPEDWKRRLRRDLPSLKQKLHRERDKDTRWSLAGDTFLAIRWVLCGFDR